VGILSDRNITNLRVKIAQMVDPVLLGRPLSLETLQFPCHEILYNVIIHKPLSQLSNINASATTPSNHNGTLPGAVSNTRVILHGFNPISKAAKNAFQHLKIQSETSICWTSLD